MDILKRIEELTAIINKANYEYHTLDNPVLSDYEYDMFLKELVELENKYPIYKKVDSPTNKIGGIVLDYFQKVNHQIPMMSLSNVFNLDELKNFYQKIYEIAESVQNTIREQIKVMLNLDANDIEVSIRDIELTK